MNQRCFTVHDFRYVSATGSSTPLTKDNVTCFVVHSETSLVGNFLTTNRIINQIQHNIQWSQLSNLMSIPTDCPQRDKRKGWLGDTAVTNLSEEFHSTFHNSTTNYYGTDGSQTSQILASALPGVIPSQQIRSSVIQLLVNDIRNQTINLTSGLIGMTNLFKALPDNGYHTLAVELAELTTYRSFGWTFTNSYSTTI
ncbi:unnamed protein product [Didymodactylos carnosus]|uniref:Alpha-L-rhamnosidase six-hairpin glycosidase domain-containing protein n=1 Tax=Didymodactylos carnosus TaxID=1234261 RepID=A0A814G8G1_9BILA|nr:unnamed protein product [Didymodactylos carnosus]CAF3764616.1 unnamed protein product [Didymodactylos carnosus]